MSARSQPLGVGRISAAVLGAPVAALLLSAALPALVPAPSDVRYFVACVAVAPATAAAPCFALLSKSAGRAWGGSLAVSALSALVLWSAYP